MRITLSHTDYERWRTFATQWNKRNPIPATRAVTYVSDGATVAARCTNLKYWLQKPVFAHTDGKGTCVIPVEYTADEPTAEIQQTKQKTTLNGKTIKTDEYEPFALPLATDSLSPQVRCYRADLIHTLKFVLPASKKDPNDQRIHGIRITTGNGTLLAEATDSYRIHQKHMRVKPLWEPSELVIYATADLVVLLNLLNGTTVSLGLLNETAYIVTDRNEYIFWQHSLSFPDTARVLPDPANQSAVLRVSAHALRDACKSLGKPKFTAHKKTYFEVDISTNRLVLTCAELEKTVSIQLYSAPLVKPLRFALDREFILELLSQLPSHATVDIGVYERDDFALTDWRVVGNETYYALISGMRP